MELGMSWSEISIFRYNFKMSDTVIRVENLSKRYVIGHQRQERYTTLRDAIANGARSLKQRIFHHLQKFEDPAHLIYESEN